MAFSDDMPLRAEEAAGFLKGLANTHRLLVLCALAEGEKNVSQLIEVTQIAPTSMSQHLNKLKQEGIVDFRREHRTLFYFISHPMVRELMPLLHRHFCEMGLQEHSRA